MSINTATTCPTCASESANDRAAQQRDAADEGRLEASGSIIVGNVIVIEDKVLRPSQLIASVRQTARVRPGAAIQRFDGDTSWQQSQLHDGVRNRSLEQLMTHRTRVVVTLILPACHFLACLAIQTELFGPSEGSWTWFPMFVVDLPFSLLLLMAGRLLPGWEVAPFLLFGVAGTAWWYFLSWALVSAVHRASSGPTA